MNAAAVLQKLEERLRERIAMIKSEPGWTSHVVMETVGEINALRDVLLNIAELKAEASE